MAESVMAMDTLEKGTKVDVGKTGNFITTVQ